MELGKYDASMQNGAANVELSASENRAPNLAESPNAKISTVANQVINGKEHTNDSSSVNGKKRPTFSSSINALKALVKNVGSLFSPKVVLQAFDQTKKSVGVRFQHVFTSHKVGKACAKKESFLGEFNGILASHKGSVKNRETAFKHAVTDTITALRKADKEGALDGSLYALVTHRLKTAFADKRQSMNLDEDTPPTVHQQLVNTLKPEDPLRQNLERHAMTNALTHAVVTSNASDSEKKTQKELIIQACAQFPPLTETTVEIGGSSYTALLLPDAKNGPDLLVKGSKLGDGGESIVFKARSLRDQKEMAVIYAKDNKNGSEEKENAKMILEELGVHKGIQGPMQLVVLKAEGTDKPVLITDILEEGDFEKYLIGEKLFTTLPPNILSDLKDYCKAPGPKEEKLQKLQNFSQNYRELLAANYDKPTVDKLFKSFERLIEKSQD